jgi:hypothetical protein
MRESVREGRRIIKRTIANLSALSLAQAEALDASSAGAARNARQSASGENIAARSMPCTITCMG